MAYFSDFDIQVQSDELPGRDFFETELEGQISFEEFEKENLKNSEN